MRRSKGTGCITAMKDGRYKYRGLIRIGVNKNGNPKNKVFYGNTKREVEEKINEFLNQDKPEPKDVIVFNDALDLLFEKSKKEKVKQKTLSIIETTSKILRRQWGENTIKNLYAKEIEEQFLIWEDNYSFSQLQKLRNYGKKAFKLICQKYDMPLNNPFDIKLKEPDEAPKLNYFSEKEIYEINNHMKGPYEDIPIFLYETGMRINECLALKFGDIDDEKNVITINKTLSETKQKNGKYQIVVTSPKTKLSYRKVPLTKTTKDIVSNQKYKKEFSNDDDLVFPSRTNTYLSARNVLRAFDVAIKKANIEKNHRGLHSIRHSSVIRLFKEMSLNGRSREIDAIDISKIIGNRVNVSAYVYDLEQEDRANRILMVLEENEKASFTNEPLPYTEKDVIETVHIGFATDYVYAALQSKRISYDEKELFKKYAYRCLKFIGNSETLAYPIAATQLCENNKLWEDFKTTGKLDLNYIKTISDRLVTKESIAEAWEYHGTLKKDKST